MIDDQLKELERSLLSSDNSFGLLTVVDFPNFNEGEVPENKIFDLRLYKLYTGVFVKNKKSASGMSLILGYDMSIGCTKKMCKTGKKNEIFNITMNDFVKVFGVFEKCKRELICDFQNDFSSFNPDKYIQRIKSLNSNAN